MKVKFIDYYNIASNLVLCTFILGALIAFIRDLNEIQDLIIAGLILVLRYFSAILIRRRFTFSKYLLLLLIARSIYRLFHLSASTNMDIFIICLVILQCLMTIAAFILIAIIPYRHKLRAN